MMFRLTGLSDTFSIDFAGTFPVSPTGETYLIVAVEYLTGWPIARATKYDTSDEVL